MRPQNEQYQPPVLLDDLVEYPIDCGIPHPKREHNLCVLEDGHDKDDPHEDADGNRWYGSPV